MGGSALADLANQACGGLQQQQLANQACGGLQQLQLANQAFGQASYASPYVYVTGAGTGCTSGMYTLDIGSVVWPGLQPQPQFTKGKSPNLAWLDRRVDEMRIRL